VTRSIAKSFLTSVLNGYERSVTCFTLREITLAPFEYKAGWAPESVSTSLRREISVAPAVGGTPDLPVLIVSYTS
jgi:hypothetical protein